MINKSSILSSLSKLLPSELRSSSCRGCPKVNLYKDRTLINFEESIKLEEFIYKTIKGEKIISDAISRCSNKSDSVINTVHEILVEEINQNLEFDLVNTIEIIKHILIYNAMVGGKLERNFLNNWIHLMEGRNIF